MPNFGLNGPNSGLKIFFQPQDHQYLLDIMPVYHNMQNQENLMIQTRENPRFGKIGLILPNFGESKKGFLKRFCTARSFLKWSILILYIKRKLQTHFQIWSKTANIYHHFFLTKGLLKQFCATRCFLKWSILILHMKRKL